MTERQTGQEAPAQEVPTPLSPEAYRDHTIQTRIIRYLHTEDSGALDGTVDLLKQFQVDDFNQAVRENRFKPAQRREMLMQIKSPIEGEGPQVQANLDRLVQEFSNSGERERVILDFFGRQAEHLSQKDLRMYIINFPTPMDVEGDMERTLNGAGEVGSEARIKAEEALKLFMDGVYGDRFKFYQNYDDLVSNAYKVDKPKEVPRMRKKRVGTVAKVGLAAAIGAGAISTALANGGGFAGTGRKGYSPEADPSSSPSSTLFMTSSPDQSIEITLETSPSFEPTPAITPEPTRMETDLENQIEEKYGIQILDTHEAYDFLGLDFNAYEKNDLGDRPLAEWSPSQIKLLGKLLSRLPEKFYASDASGEDLKFAVIQFGDDCKCSGSFRMEGLVFLSEESFKPGVDRLETLRLLAHELTHRIDYDILQNSLWPKINEMLGFSSFEEARKHYVPKLEDFKDKPGYEDMYYNFNYAFNGMDGGELNDPSEFLAELSEFYVQGKDVFMKIKSFLGKEKANEFYDFVKDELFDGIEYTSEGLPIPKNST